MAAWCLVPDAAEKFLNALRDGALSPEKLMDMTSAERRAAFAEYVGEDNAREVNAQFESKLLLEDQRRGLVNWAKKVGGITEPARRDILNTISKLDRVLQPADEQSFMEDLAAKKLGVSVTADEARTIFDASKRTEDARAEMLKDIGDVDNRIAYGRALMDLKDQVESLKPNGHTFLHNVVDVLNIPKTALTSILHFSAPFVQGWGMISTKRAWMGFGKMFQYFADEENYKNLTAYMISHPDYPLAVDGKLGITKLTDQLSQREEAIQSTLVEQANRWLSDKTGVPNLVRASSRAFTGYLNYVRFNRFTDLLNAARQAGNDVRPGSQVVHDLAKVVNDFTGRGAIGPGDKYSSAVPALNALFFSPRKISATINMFNPIGFARLAPVARNAAIRQLSGSLIATGAVLSLAKALGADVNFDPRSQDFAKITIGGQHVTRVDADGHTIREVVGGEKLDMTGGNAGYIRLLARIATGQEISANGKLTELGQGFNAPTRADLIGNWMRGKLSPIAGFIADAMYGKDPVGRPFSVTQEMQDKLMPITMEAFINYAMNDPENTTAILPSLAAVFGVSLESPLPPMSRSGRDVWGDELPPVGTPKSWRADPVNQAFEQLGYTPNFPGNTIRGQKLTDAQYSEYVQLAGRTAHMRLSEVIRSPGWDTLSPGVRLKLMKGVIRTSRNIAETTIMSEGMGGSNDILAKANAAKAAALGVSP